MKTEEKDHYSFYCIKAKSKSKQVYRVDFFVGYKIPCCSICGSSLGVDKFKENHKKVIRCES